jgi:hypothetical protein
MGTEEHGNYEMIWLLVTSALTSTKDDLAKNHQEETAK